LPTDGLWLDDTIPAAGLVADPSQLLTVGAEHPGYIAFLIGWSHLISGSDAGLAYPALIAGTLSPPLIYLALRACGYERSIGALLGAALAAAQTDIVYSGRVRTYTIDLLIVLGLVMVLPALMRVRWRWYIGVAWVIGAMVVASFSGFALGAAAVAGAFIVFRPASDLPIRLISVGAQAAATIVLFVAEGKTYDYQAIQEQYRQTWDAYPNFHLNPIQFADEALIHLRRLAEVFPDGPPWLAMICGLAALVGLALAATRGRQVIRARYLVVLIVVTFIGSLFGDLPFGPKEANPLSDGGRVSLWLVPVIAFGLAVILHALRRVLAGRRPLAIAFDLVSYAGAIAILVSALAATTLRYPFPGAHSAAAFVESQLGPRDRVLIPTDANWSFAAETNYDSEIDPTPSDMIGFQPKYPDGRLHYVDSLVDPPNISGLVNGAGRVMVYYPEHPFNSEERRMRAELATTLGGLGLQQQRAATFEDAEVDVWGHGPDLGQANLRPSDLPAGWQLSRPSSPTADRLIGCTGGTSPESGATTVGATGPHMINAIFRLDQWPASEDAAKAVSAFGGPAGARCVQSVLTQTFAAAGVPLNISISPMRPPPGAGPDAAAYRVVGRDRTGGAAGAGGSIVFFARGARTALLLGLRGDAKKAFSNALLAQLTGTLSNRLSGTTP
jgi:hypothetical protein